VVTTGVILCLYNYWAALGNVILFFVCGLPGALIYAVLALELVAPIKLHKWIMSALNNGVVLAQISVTALVLLLAAYLYGLIDFKGWEFTPKADPPGWVIACHSLFSPTINGLDWQQAMKR